MSVAELELRAVELFGNLGYIWTTLPRKELPEILLFNDLTKFLANSGAHKEVINLLYELPNDVLTANYIIWNYIKYGVWVESLNRRISLIDFENPKNNRFRVLNQVIVKTSDGVRKPDLILYINGLPLAIFEFKSPKYTWNVLNSAYFQLAEDYQKGIPELFKYALFLVVSNGWYSEFGTIHEKWINWHNWRSENSTYLDVLLDNVFNKEKLLSYIKNLVYLSDNGSVNLIGGAAYRKIESIIGEILNTENKINNKNVFVEKINRDYTTIILLKLLIDHKKLDGYSIIWFIDENDKWLSDLLENSTTFIDASSEITNKETLKNNLEKNKIYLTSVRNYLKNPFVLSEKNNLICISHRNYSTIKLGKRTIRKMKRRVFFKFKNISDTFYYDPNNQTLLDYLRITCPNAIHLVEDNKDSDENETSTLKIFLISSIFVLLVVGLIVWLILWLLSPPYYRHYPYYYYYR